MNSVVSKYKFRAFFVLLFVIMVQVLSKSIVVDKLGVAVILLTLWSLGRKCDFTLNPYYLFSLTPLSLLSYFNVVDYYLLDLTHRTYLMASWNFILFTFGLLLLDKRSKNRVRINQIKSLTNRNSILFSILFYLISLVGFILPFLYSFTWFFSLLSFVILIVHRKKVLYIFGAMYLTSLFVFGLSKFILLAVLLTLIIAFFRQYQIKKTKSKFILIAVLMLGLVVMVNAFSFANKDRGYYDANEGLEYFGREGHNWNYNASLFMPYMYFVSPWTNLQFVMDTQRDRTYGLWLIKPFVNYLQLDGYFEEEYEMVSKSNFNTFTFLSVQFKDFGFWLSGFTSFLLGYMVFGVYRKFNGSSSMIMAVIYVLFALATLVMFFSNHFLMLSYPFTGYIVLSLFKKFKIVT